MKLRNRRVKRRLRWTWHELGIGRTISRSEYSWWTSTRNFPNKRLVAGDMFLMTSIERELIERSASLKNAKILMIDVEDKRICNSKINWIKRDQLDVTCFIISLFTAQHVLDVNTSILRSLRLICWVISWVVLLWYELSCGLAEVVWYPDTTPPQTNHNVTPTHIEPEQYNPWNNSTNKSQAPEDGCINIRNMLSSK